MVSTKANCYDWRQKNNNSVKTQFGFGRGQTCFYQLASQSLPMCSWTWQPWVFTFYIGLLNTILLWILCQVHANGNRNSTGYTKNQPIYITFILIFKSLFPISGTSEQTSIKCDRQQQGWHVQIQLADTFWSIWEIISLSSWYQQFHYKHFKVVQDICFNM
jgi:hypothetical protein